MSSRRLLLSVIRPSIEYGSEVWEGNKKSQAGSLESIILDGAKRILVCSSKTCNEAVRGVMGLDTLRLVKAVQDFSGGCSTSIRPQIDVPFIK